MKHAKLIPRTWQLRRASRLLGLALALGALLAFTATASASVLRVALSHPPGTAAAQFDSIQAAVDAAHPGDWILVGPGDYHERATHHSPVGRRGAAAAC